MSGLKRSPNMSLLAGRRKGRKVRRRTNTGGEGQRVEQAKVFLAAGLVKKGSRLQTIFRRSREGKGEEKSTASRRTKRFWCGAQKEEKEETAMSYTLIHLLHGHREGGGPSKSLPQYLLTPGQEKGDTRAPLKYSASERE